MSKQGGLVVDAYNNKWHRCAPATASEIRAVEVALGVKLCPDLRRLFATCAGGQPELYWYEAPGIEWGVCEILNLVPGHVMSVQTITLELWKYGLPRGYVAFAADNGNATYAAVDQATGVVWQFIVSERRLRELAPSIEHLVGSLELDFMGERNMNIAAVLRAATSARRRRSPVKKP